jgi:hypothetical protein
MTIFDNKRPRIASLPKRPTICCIQHLSTMNYNPRFDQIHRGEFIKLLSGAATAWLGDIRGINRFGL